MKSRALFWLSLVASASAAPSLHPVGLRCEHATDPLGIDVARPRLSWRLEAAEGAVDKAQSAYQVLVASEPGLLEPGRADLWDSGKVSSAETLQIPYAGKPLASSAQAHWKVRAWDERDEASPWSEAAGWTNGLLRPEDWRGARWIGDPAAAGERKSHGWHGREADSADTLQWVQVDLGAARDLTEIRLCPVDHAGKAGFGFPLRFKVEGAEDPSFARPFTIADRTAADVPNPGLEPVVFRGKFRARVLRVTATRLWRRDHKFCFALDELEALAGDKNVALHAPASHLDSVENWGWGAAGLTDGCRASAGGAASASPGLRLRREFTVKPGLRRATLHLCGLGQHQPSVNGRPADDDWLSPGWTKYDKTCLYDTLDLTNSLVAGRNALGIDLTGGIYRVTGDRYTKFKGSNGPLQAIALVRLDYRDGSVDYLASDEQWRCSAGPVTFSCIYGGLDFDARLDQDGWNRAGFHDTGWRAVALLPGPAGELRGQASAAPPLRVAAALQAVATSEPRPGVKVFDFGQNAPLAPRLRVRGGPGAVVRLSPAELLGSDGAIDRGSCGGGQAWWQYTCRGGGNESWTPRLWYHGARYLQVERRPGQDGKLPEIERLDAVVVHSSSPPAGEFECSNDLFNRIRTLVRWAQRANLVSVITDCPHRERLGWLEQYHLHGPALRYEWDLAKLYAKTMQDMTDSQLADGLVPDIAPEYVAFQGGFRDSPEWGAAAVIVPWQQYQWTGDASLLERHYDTMKRYVAYLGGKASGHIVSHGLGDWYDIGPRPPGVAQLTPVPLTATAFYFHCADILAKSAALLGKDADAAAHAALAGRIREAFHAKFFDAARGSYATGSQTANAVPLVLGMVPAERRDDVLATLARDVEDRGFAVTAGDVGHRFLLRALADGGRSDVIFRMHSQVDRPGYGYILERGATALTEAWDASPRSSHNHFMLGHITEWFYHDLAGIRPDPAAPGFKHFSIAPQPAGDLAWVKASHQSPHGPVRVAWRREGGRFTLDTEIPPNTTATVALPDGTRHECGSGRRRLSCAAGG